MRLTTADSVRAAMLAKIAGSLLDEKDVIKLKFKAMTADQVKALDTPSNVPGFLIPYFDLDGKQTKFWRLRYLEDTRKGFDVLNGRKALRYVQAPGGVNEVYLAPFTDWRKLAENTSIPLIITEGELKSAAATKVGLPAIGLGGVWCFKSNNAKASLLPALRAFQWKDRRVVICYDSDASTNPMVVMAENRLARELTDEGASVFIARLPTAVNGDKVGVDDYLLDHTPHELMVLLMEASEYAGSVALHEMNESVVYIRDPGLVFDYKNNMRLRSADFTQHAYANFWYDDNSGPKVVKKATALSWLQWKHRNDLEAVTFAPGEPKVTKNKLNLWDGWPVKPKKGSVVMWKKLLDHLFVDTDPKARVWFEQWCAYPMQHPGGKMASAACFWGKTQGSGKTMVGHTLMKIYGQYSAEVTDDELEDKRREWAENMQFILADDITSNDNRRMANKLKTMITQKYLKVDRKFVPRYSVPDCMNYYFTANAPDAFYLEDADRRNFIHEVKADKLDEVFRTQYVAWRDANEDGVAALFHYFLELDLTGFDPFAEAFQTNAKDDMIHITKSDVALWVYDLKYNADRMLKLPGDLFTAIELLGMYDPIHSGKVTSNGMARELKKAGYRAPGLTESMAVTKFGNVRLYAIRNAELWKRKKTKDIVDHYEEHRTMEPKGKPKGSKVKF